MADPPLSQEKAAKKMKLVGRDFCGKIPRVFLDGENNYVKMEFHIHDFANRKEDRGIHFFTGIIKAHGHPWKLWINPRGDINSNAKGEYASIFLYYDGKHTESDPVVAKAVFRTKTMNKELPKYEFSEETGTRGSGWAYFAKRKDIIEKDCDDAGTLTITVELQVATKKRSVWYPQLTSCDYTQLYKSIETSDVTVVAGTKEFQLHKCVLAVRTRVLFELVPTEEESPSKKNNCIVMVLADVDETVFEVLIRFVYSSEEPKLNDLDEETIKSILLTANRFGVTELKLYAESVLIETFLVPSKAAAFLVFADAHICPLLKEESMNEYITDSTTFMVSEDDWKKLQESPKLLTELLVYTNNGRRRYSSYVRNVDSNGDNFLEALNDFDITSFRERLQQAKLDVDGSRLMLVERWRDYLCVDNNNNSSNNSETTVS